MSTVRTGTRCTKSLLEKIENNKEKENNKMAKDIYQIQCDYNSGKYTFVLKEERLYKVSENHVFDENLSVKRNREMVQEHNAKVAAQKKAELQGQNNMDNRLKEDCINFLVNYYTYITKPMAVEIYDKVYAKYGCMSDFFYYFEETADLIDLCLDMHVNPQKYV